MERQKVTMNCPKCKTQIILGNKKVAGVLVENKLTETDSFIIHYYHCSDCDYKTPIHTQIVGTKRWNEIYNQLKPAF